MPELPEVETVRRGLERFIVGRAIASADVFDSPKSFPNAPADVAQFLVGASITAVHRRAKVLLIELSSDYTLVTHLKMTGQLVFVGHERFGGGHPNDELINDLPGRFTRIVITFVDGSHLYFNDLRKFGWMKLYPTTEVVNIDFMQKVGPEPLEESFTAKEFIPRVRRRTNTSIKAAILDQSVLAGVGNIYADESLWMAKLHPALRVRDVSDGNLTALLQHIKDVMTLSIAHGGSTDKNYVDAEGRKGSYLKFANVFRREGQQCSRCGTEIVKLRVAGRGTHICPQCQQESPSVIYFIAGENSFRRDQALREMTQKLKLQAERYDGADLSENQLADLIAGATLFSSERLVVIRNLSENKVLWGKLEEWLPRVSVDTTLTIIETNPDKRTRAYKLLQKAATIIEVNEWTDRQAPQAERWLQEHAKNEGIKLSRRQVTDMVRRAFVTTDRPGAAVISQQLLVTALEALRGVESVTEEMIATILPTSSHEKVFGLLHHVAERDVTGVTRLLEQLQATSDPYMVLGLIMSQWSQLVTAAMTNKSASEVARDLGAYPAIVADIYVDSRTFKLQEIERYTMALAELDYTLKSTATNAWDALTNWLLVAATRG